MTESHNPYDTLFRTAFADPETAKELSLLLLPPAYAWRPAGAQVNGEPDLTPPMCTCSTSASRIRTDG